jgi:hypothetical protein
MSTKCPPSTLMRAASRSHDFLNESGGRPPKQGVTADPHILCLRGFDSLYPLISLRITKV